jgi:hypothetical protein
MNQKQVRDVAAMMRALHRERAEAVVTALARYFEKTRPGGGDRWAHILTALANTRLTPRVLGQSRSQYAVHRSPQRGKTPNRIRLISEATQVYPSS